MSPMAIFNEALDLDTPHDRAAYLDRACASDPDLRARVETLLAAHGRAGGFLESPAVVPTADLDSRGPVEGVGTVIGPYTLMEPLGEGGMGVVYEADQTRPVRRKVALKVIKPGMDSKQVVARFEAERQALALMDHPNIAKVHDAGTTPGGRPYFVMELVRGIPITDYCDRETLSIPERLELFVRVCRAVQHAHQKGVIHRDLKPTNILVTLHDGVPVPKVIDFGVAKATGQALTDKTIHTGFTQMVGTPLYMSPEQAELSGLDIDTRSDIYSLGVLFYELLTGTTPFESETLKRAAFDEMRRIIREEEPQRPSLRLSSLGEDLTTVSARRATDPRRLNREVRGELDWIAMKALDKDRRRRYETANDLAADVVRHLNNQPVEACPPSKLYHLQKFLRRHRSRFAAAGLIGVLGLSLAIAVGRQAAERAARRAETAGAVSRALAEAEEATRLSKWPDASAAVSQAEAILGPDGPDALRKRCRRLRQDLTMVARLDEIRQAMSAVKDDQSESVWTNHQYVSRQRSTASSSADHLDTGLADRRYGEAFRDYGIDADTLSPAAVAARMPAGPVREELVASLDDWMRVRREMHKNDDAGWKRLLAAARAADPDPWRNRVREAWEQGDQKALRELAGSAPLDRLHPCDVLLLEANLDYDRAVAVLREAQRRRPGDFWLNHALGMRLHSMQPPRFEEAIGYLRTAAALRPESPGAVLNVGHVLQVADRTDEAIAAYEQAIRLKPDYAMAYSNLGGALVDAERFDEAIRACREAIRLNPYSAAAHGNLGRALTETGELDAAIAALRESLRLEPHGRLAARYLAIACFKKVATGLRSVHRTIDRRIVRLPIPRPFLQTLLDPRSPPMLRRHFVLKLLAAGVLASPAYAQKPPRYVFTNLDVPGALGTTAAGINNVGAIVGFWSASFAGTHQHGFLWSAGVFTNIDVPAGVNGTVSHGINDAGTIVGAYDTAPGVRHGYILSGGNFTSVDVPGATFTAARGINNNGQVVGKYQLVTDAAGAYHGFLLSGGVFTTIDYPNATSTIASGINNNGQIVGNYVDAAGTTHGFLLSGGVFTKIDPPGAIYTQATKINLAGQVVGQYQAADGSIHGFLLSQGVYTAINYPNARSTYANGINDSGELVGAWNDYSGAAHGFYAVKQ
jgi:probable HAF family extracellular repeat protein